MMRSRPRSTLTSFSAVIPGETCRVAARTRVPWPWGAARAASTENTTNIRSLKYFSMVASHNPHEDIGEKLRLNIAATHYSYYFVRSGKLCCMKHNGGSGHGPAGLGQNAAVEQQVPHGLAYFVFFHSDDVINVLPDMLKIDWPNALRAQAVSQGLGSAFSRNGLNCATAEGGLRVC